NHQTGRWCSIYEIDLTSGIVKGQIQVNVHYYEQGNVQLNTRHTPIIKLSSSSGPITPTQVLKSISQAETDYQKSVNLAYMELGDDTFKQLRRALPFTKRKIDWNNIKTKIVFNDK
ncbi:F-actin-capping protein subunit alpha, partial [Melampsora americana]